MGPVTIKGIKTIVECSENVYPHYFKKLLTIVFNELFVQFLGNCVCLFMKLKSYEFEVNSLYC
jgi:hypothetical protein